MKIDLSKIDRDQFLVKEGVIAGETCYLITPNDITCKWTKDNLIYRSSIWNSDGELISASYKKFFNWEEHTEITPKPQSLDYCRLPSKIDGSTLIISKYKNQLIKRTRGTFDATILDNGFELEILAKKYPYVFEYNGETSNFSYVYEWVSPINKIVLDYGKEPDLYMTGIIDHRDYSLLPQSVVDNYAKTAGVKRPKYYNFNSFEEMISGIEALKGEEGICVYYNKDQEIRKVKSIEYLAKHRFKSNATLPNTVDLFFSLNCPSEQEFKDKLIANFDFECYQMVEQFVPTIIETWQKVQSTIHDINNFILPFYLTPKPRKEVALAILAKYKESGLSPFVFQIYDKKTLDIDSKRKMFNLILEQNAKINSNQNSGE